MTKSMFPDFNFDETDQAFQVLDAVNEMADLFIRLGTSQDVAPALGCSEAIHLAHVLAAAGYHDEADHWLARHIESDTDLSPEDVREIHGVDVDPELHANY